MKKGDPDLALNCPKCGRRLSFVSSFGAGPDRVSLVYRCPEHGRWLIPPDGDIRPQPEPVH